MKKPFNNQYATQKLLSEESATGGGVSNGATFTPGTGEQYSTTKAFKKKNEVKDKEPKLAAGKAEVYPQKKWGWKAAPSIPNRPSKGGFQYKQMFEDMEEGVLQPVDTSKDSLSPMEYQQAQHYEKFDPAQWEFDDVSKRYIKKKAEAEKVMSEALTYNKFKREAATRQGKDAFHEALKSINKKLHEINKLMEYSSNMRTELEEDYSPRTGKVVNKLEKQLAEIYKKVKSLK
jgi:hypothetical protein